MTVSADIMIRIFQERKRKRSGPVSYTHLEPFILAAGELYPSEAVKLDKSKILGFVTRYGTINSHTAVLARTKGIPSVIGLGESLKKEYEGKTIIIDGFEGKVYIEPDYTTISKMKQRQDAVSYTHLDVYKRQTWFRRIFFCSDHGRNHRG